MSLPRKVLVFAAVLAVAFVVYRFVVTVPEPEGERAESVIGEVSASEKVSEKAPKMLETVKASPQPAPIKPKPSTSVDLPPNAVIYLPVLAQEVRTHWPEFGFAHLIAGQVEQETCITLKHRSCWNPKAEFKTEREYGFGLGQLTVTKRFDNFSEAKKLHTSLADWKFEGRYDPARQLRTMVIMNRNLYRAIRNTDDDSSRIAMMLAAYNGGLGGLNQDRKLCAAKEGCKPGLWFGHTEHTSFKSKTKVGGYGNSFFDINRKYVVNVMFVRSEKYLHKL